MAPTSLKQRIKLSATSTRQRLVLVALAIGLVGALIVLITRAATGSVSLEAENATVAGNASKVSDSSASGGGALHFGQVTTNPGGNNNTGTYAFPLKLSSNNRYLVDQGGKPFLYVADTSWTMLGYLSVADAKQVIDTRKSQGFTAIQTILTPWGTGRSGVRGAAFTNNDLTQPNESYFAGVDEIIQYAQAQGMVLYIAPLWMANNGGWGYADYGDGEPAPSSAAMTSFMSWVGNRYKNQGNIIWVMGGDDEIDRNHEIKVAGANALSAADPNHLMTYHPRWAEYGFKDESWFDFYAFQKNDGNAPYNYEQIRDALALSPTKPVIDAEPPYEPGTAMGTTTSATDNRRFGWWAVLSGAFGVAYGGPRESWAVGNGSDGASSVAVDWNAINRDQAKHTGNINKILSQFAWYKLSPDWDNAVVTGGRGSMGGSDYVTAGRADDGSLIVAFAPNTTTLQVDMSKLGGAGTATWYDPASGAASGSPQSVTASGTQSFATPGNNSVGDPDWVLVIKAN